MFKELVRKFPDTAKQITQYMALSDAEKQEQESKYTRDIIDIKDKSHTQGLSQEEQLQLTTDRELIKKEKAKILYLPYLFWYYHYMGGIAYINDGNLDLIDQGFVVPGASEENAQPLNIISYKDKFGNMRHPHGEGVSVNKIVDINIKAAEGIVLTDLYQENSEKVILIDKEGFIEINPTDNTVTTDKSLIRIIIKLLSDGKNVIFNPSTFEGYNPALYDKLTTNLNTLYKNSDFVFHPQHIVSIRRSNYYKPKIDMHQTILFRPDSRLIDFLSMQLSLENLSLFINTGSYEFMSLIRIAFIFKPKDAARCAIGRRTRRRTSGWS